jgi:mannosylglycerate hydrolase MGH1-like protein
MKSLRRWQINSTSAFSLHLAADARLSSTDYHDDQIWEVLPGSDESPALALQTRFGGRAGLVSIVPLWLHDNRTIYQAQAYAKPPTITGFAPGYARLSAELAPRLALQAEFRVMESHAVGAQFSILNGLSTAATIHLDLVAFVGAEGEEQPLNLVKLPDGKEALGLGKIANLQPVILLETVPPSPPSTSDSTHPAAAVQSGKMTLQAGSKIGRDFVIEGGKRAIVRFVHAGMSGLLDSLALAQKWLEADWTQAFQQIEAGTEAIPQVETGDDDTDLTIACAYHQLVQSFLKPTASLPHASIVATRKSDRGFTPGGDQGGDRGWSGQAPTLAYPSALAAASIQAELAQGIIRNYLAVQQPDGWIDSRPGLGGQKQGTLCMPILARLVWGIFQYTEDGDFLRDVFPGLMKFFARWFQSDMDKDGDGLPEWQSEAQTGYMFAPLFAEWQGWAQGADIQFVESPDLAAYLLSEALSLKEIAYFLRDKNAEKAMIDRIAALSGSLESLWNEAQGRYRYRDHVTHVSTASVTVIQNAKVDGELLPPMTLSPPNRLIVGVAGGVNLLPRMLVKLDGLDLQSKSATEKAAGSDFTWAGGRGVYTSHTVWSQIDLISFEGLSRVYQVEVKTMDTTGLDINALLPLWATGIPADHAGAILNLLTSPEHFWRKSGVSMNSAQDSRFDPSNANGSGAVWPFWVTLIGEALIELGEMDKATELFRRLLAAQVKVLRGQRNFSEFYHADEPKGLGEIGHQGGIVPLHLMMRVFGVRIISNRKVWAGGEFFWDQQVTIRQHGVTVQRSLTGTHIEFPSGHKVDLADTAWREVTDPNG